MGGCEGVEALPQGLVIGQKMLVMIEKHTLPLLEFALEDLRQIFQHLMQGVHLITGRIQFELQLLDGGSERRITP